jgi:hypothetical protein
MKKWIVILLLLVSFFGAYAQTNDKQAINDCFACFKKGLSDKNAEYAYSFIDIKSKTYLDSLLLSIKYDDSLQVSALRPTSKLFLLCVRSVIDKSTLFSMKSVGLLDYLIKNELLGNYDGIEINKILVLNNNAKAYTESDTTFFFSFCKENNFWKYDIQSVFAPEELRLKLALDNISETEYIIQRVEKFTQNPFPRELWKAPIRKIGEAL